ncbi:phage tail protein, partial [Salmonella enterica]|nr:phage tail protein [Salmonella enterica]
MSQTDNLFDTAMSIADDTIISVMGTVATITSGVLAGTSLTGVFDDPESVSYAAGGVRIEGVSPSIFVKSSAVRQLKRADTLEIGGQNYWVDRMGPEES